MATPEKSPDDFLRAMEERRADPTKVAKSFPDDFASRPLGFLLIAGTLLFFFLYTYGTISRAHAQAASIDHKGRYVFIQPLLLFFGIAYAIFGESASKVLGPTTKPSKWGWGLWAVAVITGFLYVHQVETYLHGLGYDV